METTGRDARKRRLAERGSDRLALITGRIQELPASPSPEPRLSHVTSSVDPNENTPISDSDQATSVNPEDNISSEPTGGTLAERILCKSATSQTSRVLKPDSTTDMDTRSVPQSRDKNFINPTKVVSAVISSEGPRIFFSLAMALLVVLSYLGFPILNSFMMKGFLLYWPLYIVLLTNISMVLALLLLRGGAEQEGGGFTAQGTDFNIGMALEMSFVLQNVASALFMDCSLYSVVVICGVSLARHFGW